MHLIKKYFQKDWVRGVYKVWWREFSFLMKSYEKRSWRRILTTFCILFDEKSFCHLYLGSAPSISACSLAQAAWGERKIERDGREGDGVISFSISFHFIEDQLGQGLSPSSLCHIVALSLINQLTHIPKRVLSISGTPQ